MKRARLYNVIFPIWLILFFPPVIFIALAGNYIIDSLVIIGCFYVFRLSAKQQVNALTFYKKSIVRVWLFGFLADILGAAILFVVGITGDYLSVPNDISKGIWFDPFSNPAALCIILLVMLVSCLLIFFFNYKITFKKLIQDKKSRLLTALAMAVITAPWTFLLPTRWFYPHFK